MTRLKLLPPFLHLPRSGLLKTLLLAFLYNPELQTGSTSVFAVVPPTTDPCDNLKTTRGKTGCVQLSADLEYFLLFNKMNPTSPPTSPPEFQFTLLVQKPNLLVNKWLGLGIGLSGGMRGADFLMLTKPSGQTSWVASDRYSDDYGRPFEDKQQDYVIVSQTEDTSKLEIVVKRRLDTCDFFDMKLNPYEANFCLWAYGTASDTDSTTGTSSSSTTSSRHSMHSSNQRGSTMCDFWTRSAVPVYSNTIDYPVRAHHGVDVTAKAEIKTEHLVKSVSVQNQYVTAFLSTKQIFTDYNPATEGPKPSPRWITKIEPLIDNQALLHHIVLYSCPTLTHDTLPATVYDVLMVETCDRLILAWAVGGNGITFPNDVAFKLGEREEVIALNMHYYNPNLVPNQKDASGFTFTALTLASGLRPKYESDIWLFGDLFYQGLGNSKLHPNYHFTHYCPATCIEDMLEAKELTVLQLGYHGHFDTQRSEAGLIQLERSVFSEVVSSSTNSSFTAALQPGPQYLYDYNHQKLVESELKIERGKHGTYVRCTWDFSKRHYTMSYGDGSNDEMCFALWQYYPRQPSLGHGTCAFSLDDRTWLPAYREKSRQYCEKFCEKAVPETKGYYVKKPAWTLANDGDLFAGQSASPTDFSTYGGRLEIRPKQTLVSEMQSACKQCSHTERLWQQYVPCETCASLNITDDCSVLAYRGWCPDSILPSHSSYLSDLATRNAAIDTFAAAFYEEEEAKLCSHYCAIGKEQKSLWSCLRSGRHTYAGAKNEHFPVRVPDKETSTAVCAATPSTYKTALPDKQNQCSGHADCLPFEYCADTATWFSKDMVWQTTVENRRFCRSCSHCCKRIDSVTTATGCPSHCSCLEHPNSASCQKLGADRMLCSALPDTGTTATLASTVSPNNQGNQCIQNSELPGLNATEVSQHLCPAHCPLTVIPANTWVHYDHGGRVCEACRDYDDVFEKRMTNYIGQFMSSTSSLTDLLKPYVCSRAEHILAILKPFNPFIHVTLQGHAFELCRWSLREQVCRQQVDSSGGAAVSQAVAETSAATGRGRAPSIHAWTIGMLLGFVVYLASAFY
ncbi:unnamed protein product [Amoebophrya sp. A120]|nr:unnamed protein product [Amoebophrya sp. A120]|eukprot:GSA120T00000971001.1